MVAVIVVVWIVDPETVSDSRRISKKADFKRKIDKINETLEYRRIVVGGSFDLSIYLRLVHSIITQIPWKNGLRWGPLSRNHLYSAKETILAMDRDRIFRSLDSSGSEVSWNIISFSLFITRNRRGLIALRSSLDDDDNSVRQLRCARQSDFTRRKRCLPLPSLPRRIAARHLTSFPSRRRNNAITPRYRPLDSVRRSIILIALITVDNHGLLAATERRQAGSDLDSNPFRSIPSFYRKNYQDYRRTENDV